jgi:hypothetical protein
VETHRNGYNTASNDATTDDTTHHATAHHTTYHAAPIRDLLGSLECYDSLQRWCSGKP